MNPSSAPNTFETTTVINRLEYPETPSSRDRLKAEFAVEMHQLRGRHFQSQFFLKACGLAVVVALAALVWLLYSVLASGSHWLSLDFINNFPSRFAEKAGIKSAIFGSIWLLVLTTAFAVPVGVGAAVYLEELAPRSRFRTYIDIIVANLASVPSIVFGILGLAVFVRFLGFNRSVLSGALTLTILILPMIIIATREALKAVPYGLREAAVALGATRWQATRDHVLPAALPGILTGIILSVSRAIGESAPLMLVGAMSFVAFVPENPLDSFTALPIQIYNWASRPQAEFQELSAAAIIVLLVVLLSSNAVAILLRNHIQRKKTCQRL